MCCSEKQLDALKGRKQRKSVLISRKTKRTHTGIRRVFTVSGRMCTSPRLQISKSREKKMEGWEERRVDKRDGEGKRAAKTGWAREKVVVKLPLPPSLTAAGPRDRH